MALPQINDMTGRSALIGAIYAAFLLALATVPAIAQETAPASDEPIVEESIDDVFTRRAADQIEATTAHEAAIDPATGLPTALIDPAIDPVELQYRLVPLTKAELEKLAEQWLAIVKAKTEEVMAAQIAIVRAEGAVEDAAREHLTNLAHDRKQLFDKYSTILAAWEKKGGDPDLIAEYHHYRNSIIIEETRTADFKTLLAEVLAWIAARDGGINFSRKIAIVVLTLAGLLFAARIIRRLVRRSIGRVPNLSKLLQAFLVTVIYWLTLAIGLLIVLTAIGVDISPAFALIGGASFVLAFAFQDTLGNLASGLMIMVNRPFDEGDYVSVGGVSGTVTKMTIVATSIVTPDNQVILIPNRNVWGNMITNVTASDTRRVDLIFGISYSDSIADAIRVMTETVKAHPLVLDDPTPVIRAHELGESSVNFICRPWVKTTDYWEVHWDLTRQIKERFDAAGISIPFPQRDVHLKQLPTGTNEARS